MVKKYTKLLVINLLVFFFLIFLGEFLCRNLVKGINLANTSSDIFIDDRYKNTVGFLPNSKGLCFDQNIAIDELGFIKNKCSQSSSNQPKILFLGDSVTQGVGVKSDSSFVGRLACHYKDSVDIINAALIGHKLSDYKNVLEVLIEENHFLIKKTIINFCLNDIYGNDTQGVRVGSGSIIGRVLNYLKSNSYLYIWLKHKISDRNKAYFSYDSNFYQEPSKLKNIKAHLKEIITLCEQHQILISIVPYPYEFQLRDQTSNHFFPQDSLTKIFSELNISYHRPDPFFKKETSIVPSKALYLYGDGIHFSNQGHAKVYDFFVKEGILE